MRQESEHIKMDKEELNKRLDTLIAIKLLASSLYDGVFCVKCNIIQGREKKGVKKYYCKHITKEIDNMMLPLSKRITREFI